jgi:hypothetical protein
MHAMKRTACTQLLAVLLLAQFLLCSEETQMDAKTNEAEVTRSTDAAPKDSTPSNLDTEAALRTLSAAYWADVHALALEWRRARGFALTHGDEWDPDDRLHDVVSGSDRVIYQRQAMLGLLFTDHPDAYEDATGDSAKSPEGAMQAALLEDVRFVLGEEFSTADAPGLGGYSYAEHARHVREIREDSLAEVEDLDVEVTL